MLNYHSCITTRNLSEDLPIALRSSLNFIFPFFSISFQLQTVSLTQLSQSHMPLENYIIITTKYLIHVHVYILHKIPPVISLKIACITSTGHISGLVLM